MQKLAYFILIAPWLLAVGCSSNSSAIQGSAVATHFSVVAPGTATVGTAFSFTVTALSASNNIATGYAGTVHFTSTDGSAVLPANTKLTNGTGSFSATLKTTGSQTIMATDTVTSSITGTSNSITVSTASSSNNNNIAPLVVDGGIDAASPTVNQAFTTVVVCPPGTPAPPSGCDTLEHVLVDTGSVGLRIPASALTNLSSFNNVNTAAPVAECYSFMGGNFFWGSVRSADVYIGGSNNLGEVASSVPIHVLGDQPANSAPSFCVDNEGTEDNTAFGSNGLLGVGNYQYDCDVLGNNPANPCTSTGTAPPGMYYNCSGGNCSVPAVAVADQVRNPVSKFAKDNNGVILELPSVASGGATGASGELLFGIGTESNNGLSSSATVLTIDSNENDLAWAGFTTVFDKVSYPNSANALSSSFLDSGSNGIFFLDQPTTGIPSCSDWYCPTPTDSLTAKNQATGGNSSQVSFNVANADTLFSNNGGNNIAYNDLAGPITAGSPDTATQAEDGYFDWGLTFFYGRNVYTAIWGVTPPSSPASGVSVPAGPFWAY